MKRKLLIFSALISLLLAGFQFPIYADEDPSDTPSSVPVPNSIRLDQYFYDNYILLPYIESSGEQYIDTGINGSSNLRVDIRLSDLDLINSENALFGSREGYANKALSVEARSANTMLCFANNYAFWNMPYQPFSLLFISFDDNKVYVNNSLIYTFADSDFSNSLNISIFAVNNNNSNMYFSKYKLYSFNIYDYSTESYLRYYIPAKSKSGGVIGLYDAVSDTFVTTSGSVPFASPIDDQVLNLQIGTFLTAGLGWIGDILEFAVETPIILVFMAIGLAGAMFRWGRRLVHF